MVQRIFTSKFINYLFGDNVDKNGNCQKHVNIVSEKQQTFLYKNQKLNV